jgi:hypothetical protein
MDDLSFLRARIATYADYAHRGERHLVDQQVRAWVGEAVAAARERLRPEGDAGDLADRVIFRCEFSDQALIRASDHGSFSDAPLVEHIHALDRALIETADGAATVDASGFPALLARLDGLLDERARFIVSVPVKGPAEDVV